MAARPVRLTALSPTAAATQLSSEAGEKWARQFLQAFESQLRLVPLERLMATWELSASATARVFGVSRQAVAKWRITSVPADRLVVLADLSAATDVLERHVRRDRIPAVVRRPAPFLGGVSLLQMAETGQSVEVRRRVTEMFDLRRVAP
jgi:hypothetical protein